MCGLHFVLNSSGYATNTDDFMKDAYIANQVRGTHSSGIAQVTNGVISMYKKAVNGVDFIQQQAVAPFLQNVPKAELTMGHVRAATHGAITSANAHPFIITRSDQSRVVGVHNGTLDDWKSHKDAKDFEVDSEWALHMIAEHGEDAFQYFTGAYAFIWYDSRDPDAVFIARNDRRPLGFLITENGRTILGASELGMLGWLAERNKFKISQKEGQERMFTLTPNKMYRFDLKKIGTWQGWDLPKFDRRLLPIHQTSNTSDYYGGRYATDERYGTSRVGGYYSGYSQFLGQTSILNECTRALKAAKFRRMNPHAPKTTEIEPTPVVTSDDLDAELERNMATELTHWKRTRDVAIDTEMLIEDKHMLNYPSDTTATRNERNRAKEAMEYGMVVPFTPFWFDEETSETVGVITTTHVGGKRQDLDAIIRMETKASVYDKAMEDGEPVPVAIIGYDPGNPELKVPDTYIVATLTTLQERIITAYQRKSSDPSAVLLH